MEEEMELRTIADLMRERDRLNDILEMLKAGDVQKAIEKITRDIKTITEALESK